MVGYHREKIRVEDLVMPYFVIDGARKRNEVPSMPGIERLSIDNLLKEISRARDLGIERALLFGVTSSRYKDERGSYGYSSDGIIPRAVSAIKERMKDITVITDVCLCAYTSHGHCGIIEAKSETRNAKSVFINNKKTLEILEKMALAHAEAGADWVAPSAMAKGQVAAIRGNLDKKGYKKTKILGYSAKFASNFYAPFRDAADSGAKFGDRTGYQLDYRDARPALDAIGADIKEGADMVMVKPALAYLDIIKEAKNRFSHPLAAYNVSGEYAMVKNYLRITNDESRTTEPEKDLVMEIITAIKRAGADTIITYHAKDIAKWLR